MGMARWRPLRQMCWKMKIEDPGWSLKTRATVWNTSKGLVWVEAAYRLLSFCCICTKKIGMDVKSGKIPYGSHLLYRFKVELKWQTHSNVWVIWTKNKWLIYFVNLHNFFFKQHPLVKHKRQPMPLIAASDHDVWITHSLCQEVDDGFHMRFGASI